MNETHPTREQLVDFLHGELPARDDAAVHAHVAACGECAQAHADEAALTGLLRTHAAAEERELPESVVANIRAAVAQKPSALERLRSALRPVILVPAAAAVAVALYIGFVTVRAPVRATTIDAAYYVDSHAALSANAPFSEDAPMPAMLTSDASYSDERPVDETR